MRLKEKNPTEHQETPFGAADSQTNEDTDPHPKGTCQQNPEPIESIEKSVSGDRSLSWGEWTIDPAAQSLVSKDVHVQSIPAIPVARGNHQVKIHGDLLWCQLDVLGMVTQLVDANSPLRSAFLQASGHAFLELPLESFTGPTSSTCSTGQLSLGCSKMTLCALLK